MFRISILKISLLFLIIGPRSIADDFVCHWAHGPIAIDGNGDDQGWKHATTIDRFVIPGTASKLPSTSTKAKLLWDRQYLYFMAELEDHDLFADVVEHDGKTWDNDVFELFLKPSRKATGYYEFQVNAAGTRMDLFLLDQKSGGYDALKSSHPFHWNSSVQRKGSLNARNDRDESWTVEGRIPWIDLMPTGGRPDIDEIWQIAICRYDYTLGQPPELSSSAQLSKVNFHSHEEYTPIRFAGPSETNSDLHALRSRKHRVESKLIGSPDPRPPYHAVRAYPNLHLEWPVDVQVEPGSRRFVIIEEQGAYGSTKLMRTTDDPNLGLLEQLHETKGVAYSIAFHPNFLKNGFMYIGSNGKANDNEKMKSRVIRHTLSRTAPYGLVGDPTTIIDWESNGHNGAAVTFGNDGMMYVTSGDGTSDSDRNVTGQDLTKLLAKVLRINVDQPDEGRQYSVPKDNPFINNQDAVPETWAYGLRNPWRITTDKKTGHIWVGNNGQDMWEQVYLIERGANYGWSVFEGGHPFYSKRQLGPTPHVLPTVEHPHGEARSLTGGVVYYGSKFPELQGVYVYGDYSTGKIWGVKHNGTNLLWHKELADTPFQISAISVDHDSEIIVVDHRGDKKGGLYHLEASPADDSHLSFPKRLSETGLFQDVASHRVNDGLIPYGVNAPFWSDGAIKSRFIALPEKGHIEITDQWGWQFPENTVTVKSFALETVAGDPSSRKWIETRLMTKQQGEWVGYSYAWNEDQSDAILVESKGTDREFTIQAVGGVETQTWHYPSRTECMVCHTRAANYVLGLSTVQMNRTHTYYNAEDNRNITLNQLTALETMGVLQTKWHPAAQSALRKQLDEQGVSKEAIEEFVKKQQVSEGQRTVGSTALLGKDVTEYPHIVDPYDSTTELELRARAFLHSNCAYCHVEAGGGNAKMDLSIYASRDAMKIFDIEPTHHTFEKVDARLIAPGSVERSVLLHRMGTRGPGQMPQLSTSRVDEQGLNMMQQWVNQLSTDPGTP